MFWLFLCVRTQLICEINRMVITDYHLTRSLCESYLWIGSSIPNFTSDGANLTITQSNITQEADSYLEGFSNIHVQDSWINTQCNSLNLLTIIFKNVTFVDQMQLNAQAITLHDCTIRKIHFVTQQTLSIIYLQNVRFVDCLFYNTTFASSEYSFINLTLIGSTLVYSTLGSVKDSSFLQLSNVKLVESTLLQIDNITNINLENVQLSYSKLLVGQSSIINDVSIISCSLIASNILHLTKIQFIQRLKIYNSFATNSFFNLTSDQLIIQEVDIYNVTARRIFSLTTSNLMMQNLKLNLFKSVLYYNNLVPVVQIADITLINSESNTFQNVVGNLSIMNATLNNYSGIFVNSSQSDVIQIANINIFNYSSHNFINITNCSLMEITNLSAQYFGYVPEDDQVILTFTKVATLKFSNISFTSINDTLIFQMKQVNNIIIEQLSLSNSTFIKNTLIQANASQFYISKLFIYQVTTNSNIIVITQATSFDLSDSKVSKIISSPKQALFSLNNINYVQLNFILFTDCQNLIFFTKKSNVKFYNNILDQINSQMIILMFSGQFDARNNIFRNVQYDLNRSIIQIFSTRLSDINIFNNNFEGIERRNQIQLTTNSIEAPNQQIMIDGPVYLTFGNQTYIINELLNNISKIVVENVRSSQNLSLIAYIQDSQMKTVCRQQDVVVFQDITFVFDTFKCKWNIKYQFILDSPDNSTAILPINFTGLYQNDSNLLINLQIDFLGCQLGEIWISNTCQRCQSGTYTYDRINCKDCPMSGQSCPGGAVIILRQGYWRPHNLTDNIAYCTISNNQCDGGSDNYTCQVGYVGAICSDCDYYKTHSSESYSYSVIWGCQRCNFDQKLTIEFIFAILWMVTSLILSMKGTINLVRQQILAYYLQLGGFISASRSMLFLDYSEILLKIFTTYFQLISIVSVAQIQYPPSFQNLTQIIGNPINALYYSTGCFLINLNLPIEIVYFRQIWNFIFSFSLVVLLTIIYYLYTLLMKNNDVKIKNIFLIVLLQVYYQFQGDLIQGLLQIVFCLKASGDDYILASTQFQCYTYKHYFYQLVLVLPGLIITLFIFPTIYLYNLIQNRKRPWSYDFRQKYGYLISEYKIAYFYWEFIKILMKNIFYLLQTLLIQEKKLLYLTAILVLIAYQHLVSSKKPFVDGKFNKLETVCAASAYLTIILVFLQEYNQYNAVVIISNSICGLQNIILVLYFVFQIVLETIEELKKSYIHKIIILIKKYPCFGSIFRRQMKFLQQDQRVAKLLNKFRSHVHKIIQQRRNRERLEQQTRDEVRSSVELGRHQSNKSFDFIKADIELSSLDRTERQFIDRSTINLRQKTTINATSRIRGRSIQGVSSTLLQYSGILRAETPDKTNKAKKDAKVYPKIRKIKI